MVDFECGELNWTEINQESKKKFHKLGKLGSSKSGEGIAKFGFSYPSHPFYSKYQATTSTRWKIYKKKKIHVKGKEPLINCLFFSFPLFYSEIQETTSTRWKTLTYIRTTPKSFFFLIKIKRNLSLCHYHVHILIAILDFDIPGISFLY